MCVVETLDQLENTLRYEVNELLIIGRIAVQIRKAMTGEKSFIQEWSTRYKNILWIIQTQYYIVEINDNERNACLLRKKNCFIH
ncbi:MAG: hypothetical protein AB9917_02950 [Negativicutes bacterium]